VCDFSKLADYRQCVESTNCESFEDGKAGRLVDMMTYICSDNVKPS